MSINRSFISSQSIQENTDVSIEMLAIRPDVSAFFESPVAPNILSGYYDPLTDQVELYIIDPSGNRYVRIR
jgi:hypothetical protein